MTKVTKKDNFKAIETILREMGNDTLADVMAYEIELLVKKNANRKPSKTQAENEGLKAIVAEVLATMNKAVSVKELQNADPRLSVTEYSNQKITAILRMIDGIKVEKVKGVSVYSI